ncbi:MAG: hypothetical protein R3C16_05680 [Hyphomonadaceae bacterium]
MVIIGDGRQQGVDAANALFADPPSPFRVRMAVTIDGLDVAHPELQGLNPPAAARRRATPHLERLMERNVINFAWGRSRDRAVELRRTRRAGVGGAAP